MKNGEYVVSLDDAEDDVIVQTEERVRVEHDVEDGTQASEPGVVKEEISGTTTSRITNEEVPGEKTIKVSQEKEKREASEEKETTSERKQVNEQGRLQKEKSMNVR